MLQSTTVSTVANRTQHCVMVIPDVPEIWEDNKEACTKRSEENRAKDQAGAERERHGKKQLDKFPVLPTIR